MARGPTIISSGSRNKPLRSYLSSDQRGEVYCYQVHPNQTAHIHWSWMPRWPCVWFCAYALWNPFRGGGGGGPANFNADARENEVRTRDRCVGTQRIGAQELKPRPRHTSPLCARIVGPATRYARVAAAAWRAGGQYNRGADEPAAGWKSGKLQPSQLSRTSQAEPMPTHSSFHCSRKILLSSVVTESWHQQQKTGRTTLVGNA